MNKIDIEYAEPILQKIDRIKQETSILENLMEINEKHLKELEGLFEKTLTVLKNRLSSKYTNKDWDTISIDLDQLDIATLIPNSNENEKPHFLFLKNTNKNIYSEIDKTRQSVKKYQMEIQKRKVEIEELKLNYKKILDGTHSREENSRKTYTHLDKHIAQILDTLIQTDEKKFQAKEIYKFGTNKSYLIEALRKLRGKPPQEIGDLPFPLKNNDESTIRSFQGFASYPKIDEQLTRLKKLRELQ